MMQWQMLQQLVLQSRDDYAGVFWGVSRYVIPILALWILVHCAKPLISFRREPELWAWLKFGDGTPVAVTTGKT